MQRTISTSVAAALLLAAAPASASADVLVRDTEETKRVKETCTWLVDEQGNRILDSNGEPVKQQCVEEEVGTPGSSGKAKWVDDESGDLALGAILGIVGALAAGVIGMSLLFIESVDIHFLPARR